jgi:hypothetical protein
MIIYGPNDGLFGPAWWLYMQSDSESSIKKASKVKKEINKTYQGLRLRWWWWQFISKNISKVKEVKNLTRA